MSSGDGGGGVRPLTADLGVLSLRVRSCIRAVRELLRGGSGTGGHGTGGHGSGGIVKRCPKP